MTRLAGLFVEKRTTSAVLLILVLVWGYSAYQKLARFEDPEFVIRTAVINVPYPGARPNEVAEEVTDLIESAAQQLQEVKEITSVSRAGMAEVKVEMLIEFSPSKNVLEGLWTKLRNKLRDVEKNLPPGAGPIIVNDDFGDVFALFYAVTGEGYSLREVQDYVRDLRKELLIVPGVARVALLGEAEEAVFIEIARERAASLGISPDTIYSTLKQQNVVGPGGKIDVGPDYVEIAPIGQITSVDAIENLLLSGQGAGRQILLRDIATVSRGYIEPPDCMLRYDGQPAVGLGISAVSGGNVVETAKAVRARLAHLEALRPIGMDLHTISDQGDTVDVAITGFVVNLIESLAIVVITLLIFMGLRSGVIMGAVLLVTVCGTLVLMQFDDIAMQRISLGALIIALGMLVDNAIVVTEGILIGVQSGGDRRATASSVVAQTAWPLLGGTIVGILAFSAIGLSPDATGEYAGSLFWVIGFSLFLSWVFAITFTPFLCSLLLTPGKKADSADPYDSWLYHGYQRVLKRLLQMRWATSAGMLALLAAAMFGFGFVPAGFFPESSRAQFVVDFWRPEGADIRATHRDLTDIEGWVRELDGVMHVTAVSGSALLRFMLTYAPESPSTSYGQLLIDVDDYRRIPGLITTIQDRIDHEYPDGQAKAWKFILGPGGGSKIQAEFRGPDAATLRDLANQAKEIFHADPQAVAVKDDWREPVKVVRPVFSEVQARRAGVSLEDFREALQQALVGTQVGIYREQDRLIPIIARSPETERADIHEMQSVQVYSRTAGAFVPIMQLISEIRTEFENPAVRRVDRFPTITAMCDPASGILASEIFERVRPKVESIPLPPGYALEWEGEYGDSQKAQSGLMSTLPFSLVAMVLTILLLFGGLRQVAVIWLTVPLAVIGVTIGLLLFQAPFEFMAILGFLSLIGMLVKNAVVLVDQIDLEIREGKERFRAIIDSSVSRVRPVSMGALTTVLGVSPLVFDPFFRSMAVTIMFGLTFATVLTLFFVPVLYAIVFRIREA